MRKVEIMDDEILITKQALSLFKEKLEEENTVVNRLEIEVIDRILLTIKEELTK